jgi:hypothetical protein
MSEVVILVEGLTEKIFVSKLLAPYLAAKSIFVTPIILSKPGERGGDVKFTRAQRDIASHLKQRKSTWITLMVDYYGIRGDWPGYDASKQAQSHQDKADVFNQQTEKKIKELYDEHGASWRFIPYVSMHEIEALLFSDPEVLAEKLQVDVARIHAILRECGEPEKINDSSETAPSRRLKHLAPQYGKTTMGIAIAEQIGIDKMRSACPLFHAWLHQLESLS